MFLGRNCRQDVFLGEYKNFLEIFVLHEYKKKIEFLWNALGFLFEM